MNTVAALFDTYENAEVAVKALEDEGIPANQISIVSNRDGKVEVEGQGNDTAEGATSGAGIGAIAGGAGGLVAGLGLLAIPGVGPVVAAGWLTATAVGAVAGAAIGGAAGGMVGAMVSSGVPEDDANAYVEGVRRGGTVVTAKVEDREIIAAQAILDRARAVNLPARRALYAAEGWTRFDEGALPYSPEQIADERKRYGIVVLI